MNQKVSTGLGTAILLVIAFTAGYFVWIVEKNNQQTEVASQTVLFLENKRNISETESKQNNTTLLCVLIGEKVNSLEYKNRRKNLVESFDTFSDFEVELSKWSSEKDIYIDTICATYRQVVFLGLNQGDVETKGVLGFYNWQDKELKLKEIENTDVWQIQGFIGENENVLLSQSGGYAESSCHIYKQYIYDVSKNVIKKIQDCSGCDDKSHGASYTCSLDFLE